MKKKITNLVEEKNKLVEQLEETNKLLQLANEEEIQFIDGIKSQINKITTDNDMFCGVILSKHDILGILDIMLTTGESVKVGYNIYYNETTDKK